MAVGFPQTEDEPAIWSYGVEQLNDSIYELTFKGDILKGWHVYSQHYPDGGALPSEFTFEKIGEDYKLIGETVETGTVTEYSDIFELEEIFFKDKALFTQKIKVLKFGLSQINVTLFYQICKELCINKNTFFAISLNGDTAVIEKKTIDAHSTALSDALLLNLKNKELLLESNETKLNSNLGIWKIFGLGFLGGLLALLTPCVFPMIPLTVSFFTKQSTNKVKGVTNAMLYGLFIVLIYFLLSIPFHLFDSVDSQILNTIATNIWLNVGFFLIFVFFAFSFFGYYELTLPNSWANKMDSISTKTAGIIGIFFMAVTLAIVSFSCTGPILGGLLGSTILAEGDVATNLSAGMLGFGVALALPFAFFALFPAWLNSLPKSGGWMTTVKVILGFLELALAFKFLSNADMVGGWGVLKREIFLGIWIVLFILLSLYLFRVFVFPHDGPKQKLTIPRIGAGLVSIAFTIYMLMGVFNLTHLKLLSGFPPPEFYSVALQKNDCSLGINCFKDFEKGLEYAKSANKPILIGFTGWACVNCRKMEESVWSEADIYPLLKNDYVLVSLYIDDRKLLPKEKQFDLKFDSGRVKTIKTVGEKWGAFQTLNFNTASQPYYVLLTADLEILSSPIQYTDRDSYKEWLVNGLKNFKKINKLAKANFWEYP